MTTTMSKTYRSAGRLLAGFTGLVLMTGCHHDEAADARPHGEVFIAEGETRDVNRFIDAQAAAGARSDAMLRDSHFDRTDLNSLGQEKIDYMLKADAACTPLVVYMDMAPDELLEAREASVKTYLKDRGLSDAQIKLEQGPNKHVLSPAAAAMRAKKLIDSGASVAVNPEPTGSAGSSTTGH
jgi:hypothetical protein